MDVPRMLLAFAVLLLTLGREISSRENPDTLVTLETLKQEGALEDVLATIPPKCTQEYARCTQEYATCIRQSWAVMDGARQKQNVERECKCNINTGSTEVRTPQRTVSDHEPGDLASSPDKTTRENKSRSDEDRDEEGNPVCHVANYQAVLLKYPASVFGNLYRIEADKVGDVVEIDIGGRKLKRYTKAIQPPVYEIPDFLTKEECDIIVKTAQQGEMHVSRITNPRVNVTKDLETKDLRDVIRVSNTTSLEYKNETLKNLRKKIVQLLDIPRHFVFSSEPLQVVRYEPGGHYHAHMDSFQSHGVNNKRSPCCHLLNDKSYAQCNYCRICRFATVLMYLNDVEEGGETAFPWARLSEADQLPKTFNQSQRNLSYNCHSANLVVKPRRGTAIMWYSHFLDKEGWLGASDAASFHGGCDVIKGEKWIATTWINAPSYDARNRRSLFWN